MPGMTETEAVECIQCLFPDVVEMTETEDVNHFPPTSAPEFASLCENPPREQGRASDPDVTSVDKAPGERAHGVTNSPTLGATR
jgi:hypothetical protein